MRLLTQVQHCCYYCHYCCCCYYSCALPGVFSGAVLALAKADQTGSSYKAVIEDNAVAGGDNCSRAIYIGACLAAEQGAAALPQEWKSKTLFYSEAEQLLDELLGQDSTAQA
jgi:ADP-ribosylglycohydrolase